MTPNAPILLLLGACVPEKGPFQGVLGGLLQGVSRVRYAIIMVVTVTRFQSLHTFQFSNSGSYIAPLDWLHAQYRS